ncbi:GYF [Glarea lozoyensis ATCC 20868]|uniref:GYF n=1 Tax=Glarea lozoyensis (strain ATCC 20868 / MF5171) TaxID=1116229 RepID=S3CKZ2_GLAL2|nr:GYF [Glarea lozoyensis ATCC 20868]EPE27187.1 GYF [Glarea lozoyensis ATCC 20868]
MASRFSAARPNRAGEQFARTHHLEADDGPSPKKPKFDIRNPSALAPDAPEEDAVLEADVIGGAGTGTKRGAVNIDGYDSDSENEGFDARAEERAKARQGKPEVSLADALDGYAKDGSNAQNSTAQMDDDDEDMFADLEEEVSGEKTTNVPGKGRKEKEVRFMEADEIQGQVENSKSGGHVSGNFALDPKGKLSTHAMDDQESSDDEEDAEALAAEEGIDDEVGAGGLKRNAPKVDAFNMKAEQEEGRFDDAGNFIRKAADPDSKHDTWLEGVSKKDMKKAAEAHEKREAELRQQRLNDDAQLLPDILRNLILQLEKGETVLEALGRLGKSQVKTKKIPKWKAKKQKQADESMDVDPAEDPVQLAISKSISSITTNASLLLTRGQTEIYEQEREMLIRQYRKEAGEDWVEPAPSDEDFSILKNTKPTIMWEYRWTDGRDGDVKQGPYDGATMKAWNDAGYFAEGIEFRRIGEEGWSRVVDFV